LDPESNGLYAQKDIARTRAANKYGTDGWGMMGLACEGAPRPGRAKCVLKCVLN
jgi:hypothetical protein